MKAYILSAGLGTRLYPVTYKIPKVMLPINGKPVLWYQIRLAKFYGFDEMIINLHKNAKEVTSYFKNGSEFGVKIYYAKEKKLLGTAGSVKAAEKFFNGETFLVMYGDTLRTTNFKRLFDFHKKKKGICTIALYKTLEPWTQGIIEIDKNNEVISFAEKPEKGKERSNLSNAGVLICESEVFSYIPKGKFADFGHDVLPNLTKVEKVFALETDDYIQDIGTAERYKKAKKDFKKGLIKFPLKVD